MKGFTLIELLVVITIIAVLSVIGLVAYSGFLKNSRDAKRQSDLRIIQSALEDYHSDQIYYPASVIPGQSLPFGTKTYLNHIPTDPKSPREYSYVPGPSGCSGSTCIRYCLYAFLENLSTPKTEDPTNCPNNSTYNFAITRP